MMTRPTVLTLDTLDDRREVFAALARGLTPAKRLDFLDWCLEFARQSTRSPMLRQARADRVKMQPLIMASLRGDAFANMALSNEVYADIAGICHQWGVDYRTCIVELESWAKGREPTPPRRAASNLRESELIRTLGNSTSDRSHSRGSD